jgi:hypothetical protein
MHLSNADILKSNESSFEYNLETYLVICPMSHSTLINIKLEIIMLPFKLNIGFAEL